MQPTPAQKKKYVMEEYVSGNRANPIIKIFNHERMFLTCICDSKDAQGFTCFKCTTFVHTCLAAKPNRGELYECCSCLNKALDPLTQVRKILIESFFRTFSIFEYVNILNFEFTLTHDDMSYPVEVRGLFPDNTTLSWPMQGAFFINDEKTSVHELKPLLVNSNRKHRREEYFHIPTDKLKIGKNFVRFKIPCLDRAKFTAKYQHEDKKVYYMAVNSVQRLSPGDLETQTFRERRMEKADSIRILRSNNAEIEVTQNKVCLMCPYTRQRIKVPVRGRYCKHFSCICLQTLVVTHTVSRHWGCPICQLKMNEPYVDVWIYNMLKDNQQGSEVNVKEDGTYEWVKVEKKAMMSLDSDQDSAPFVPPLPKTVQAKAEVVEPEKKKQPQKEIKPKESKELKEKSEVKQKKEKKEAMEIEPVRKNPPIQADIISLDDDEPETNQRKKDETRRDLVKKAKEAIKFMKQDMKKTERSELSKGKEPLEAEENKKKEDKSIPKPRMPLLTEVKLVECKEMKPDEFKRLFFKSKVNAYRKYVQNEEFKRLFKEIL